MNWKSSASRRIYFLVQTGTARSQRGRERTLRAWSIFRTNPDLRLEVDVEELPEKHTVEMQTSTGSVQSYIRYGTFKFNVDGQQAELTLFSDRHGFFLPFADALAGKATYGGAATWSRSSL